MGAQCRQSSHIFLVFTNYLQLILFQRPGKLRSPNHSGQDVEKFPVLGYVLVSLQQYGQHL